MFNVTVGPFNGGSIPFDLQRLGGIVGVGRST